MGVWLRNRLWLSTVTGWDRRESLPAYPSHTEQHMPGRLIEIILPTVDADRVRKVIDDKGITWSWAEVGELTTVFKLLAQADEVEIIVDAIQPILKLSNDAMLLVLPIEAYAPRLDEDRQASVDTKPKTSNRISRDELYEDLNEFANTSSMFLAMTILSSIVAAIGLSRNSPAVIIGAMVIAPLLGPNMSLALATALGDTRLAIRALKTNIIGVSTAASVGLISGLIWPLDLSATEIVSRTSSSFGEIVLALATGIAGALALSVGVGSSLVGVMVAVALLPPVIIASMLLVQGSTTEAMGALLLAAINVVCLNLAGILTFYLKGIKPNTWWEAERAKRSTRTAIVVWIGLLIIVIALVAISNMSP